MARQAAMVHMPRNENDVEFFKDLIRLEYIEDPRVWPNLHGIYNPYNLNKLIYEIPEVEKDHVLLDFLYSQWKEFGNRELAFIRVRVLDSNRFARERRDRATDRSLSYRVRVYDL